MSQASFERKPQSIEYVAAMFKTLGHPTRCSLLFTIREQSPASPSMLADGFRASLGSVSYHVRQLELHGLLRLVGQEQRRGAVEHFYCLTEAGEHAADLVQLVEANGDPR